MPYASAPVAQNRMDDLAACMDPDLLEAIRRAKLPLLLRFGQCLDRSRSLDGEFVDIFVASVWLIDLSDPVHNRFAVRGDNGNACVGRNRVHVRFKCSAVRADAEPVSYSDTAVAAVGDLAAGI